MPLQDCSPSTSPMPADTHVRCPYCLGLYPLDLSGESKLHHEYPFGCPRPLYRKTAAGGVIVTCFTCGMGDLDHFSKTQLSRGANEFPARCTPCIQASNSRRFEPRQQSPQSVGEELHNAVSNHDVERVKTLLDDGADANYVRSDMVRIGPLPNRPFSVWVPALHPDGTPVPEEDPENEQPTTPLKLVGFRISDCLLENEHILEFEKIANLLLAYGADPISALQIMENRYGKYDPNFESRSDRDLAFTKVFETIYRATKRKVGVTRG